MVEIPVHDQEKMDILVQSVSRGALNGLADAHTHGKGSRFPVSTSVSAGLTQKHPQTMISHLGTLWPSRGDA